MGGVATGRLVELSVAECMDLIGEEGIGRLAFDDGEWPTILPVNYTFHGGVIHIRSGDDSKLRAADRRARAAFEVDAIREELAQGWSVVVRGRLKRMAGAEESGFEHEPRPVAEGERPYLIGLDPASITGRELHPTGVPPHQPAEPEGNIWLGRDGTDLLG
ncbi:MAG: pyridoxamine 5'-phosphate oxidase family protein [Nitriliruptorales bacterium]|nr:pyridoxamine 5'-phosphate oxidase family protein [Nitriliruptorales bacterium]